MTAETHSSPTSNDDAWAVLRLFARGVAHEVANPLNAISMHAELVKGFIQRGNAARAEEVLNHLIADCTRSGRLLQEIRRFGNALEDQPRVRLQAHELIAPAIAAMRREIGTGVPEFQLDGANGLTVHVDAAAVEAALAGIFRNAVEAGADRVDVAVRQIDEYVVFDIRNNGRLVPEGVIDRVAEPFFSTRRADGAGGLGLTLARIAARRHGGDLAIHSNPTDRTWVELRLPLAEP